MVLSDIAVVAAASSSFIVAELMVLNSSKLRVKRTEHDGKKGFRSFISFFAS